MTFLVNSIRFPFDDLIYGDWFSPLEQDHHSGMVYLNGEWLIEAANLAEVLEKPEKNDMVYSGR